MGRSRTLQLHEGRRRGACARYQTTRADAPRPRRHHRAADIPPGRREHRTLGCASPRAGRDRGGSSRRRRRQHPRVGRDHARRHQDRRGDDSVLGVDLRRRARYPRTQLGRQVDLRLPRRREHRGSPRLAARRRVRGRASRTGERSGTERARRGHLLPRYGVHPLDGRDHRSPDGRRPHARRCLRGTSAGRALARRRPRRRGLVHGRHQQPSGRLGSSRNVVPRGRGHPPHRLVRPRRAARPGRPARHDDPLPDPCGVRCAHRAPCLSALPTATPPSAGLDRRHPRARRDRDVRGGLGHDHPRGLRPSRDCRRSSRTGSTRGSAPVLSASRSWATRSP